MSLTRRSMLLAPLLPVLCRPARADVVLAPADQYFSVTFPEQPEQKFSERLGIKNTIYGSKNGGKVLMVAHALWPPLLNPLDGVQSMINSLVERVSAELLSIEKTTFDSTSGKKLPATRFTFGSPRLWGQALLVVAGQRSYMVQVVLRKPSEALDASDKRFFSSFKINA